MFIANYSPPLSKMTELRMSYERSFENMSNGNDDLLSKIITSVLYNNIGQLQSYVLYNGEKPVNNPLGVMLQAAVIRGQEIAYESESINGTNIEGLHSIEDRETEAKELNYPDNEYILSGEVQAAIKKMLERINVITIDSDCDCPITETIKAVSPEPNEINFSVFELIGDTTQDDPMYNDQYWKDQSIIWGNMYPVIGDEPVSNSFDLPSTFGNDIFSFIDKVFNKATEGIQSVKDKISDFGGDVAAKSVKEAIIENLPIVLMIIVALGLVVYLSIYAANNSRQA